MIKISFITDGIIGFIMSDGSYFYADYTFFSKTGNDNLEKKFGNLKSVVGFLSVLSDFMSNQILR